MNSRIVIFFENEYNTYVESENEYNTYVEYYLHLDCNHKYLQNSKLLKSTLKNTDKKDGLHGGKTSNSLSECLMGYRN